MAEVASAFDDANKAAVEEVLDGLGALGVLADYRSRTGRRWQRTHSSTCSTAPCPRLFPIESAKEAVRACFLIFSTPAPFSRPPATCYLCEAPVDKAEARAV